ISAAKHLNAAITKDNPGPRRRGCVFPDRYHAEIITSPRQARHALAHVVGNWRKNNENRAAPMASWTVDWLSNAVMFHSWAEHRNVRSSHCLSAPNVASEGGLEETRTHLLSRGPVTAAIALHRRPLSS